MEAATRTTVRGPTFIRLLTRLAHVDAPPSNESLPDRLSQWLNWSHALALATALDGTPAVIDDAPVFDDAMSAECARVRAAITESIGTHREMPGKDGAPDFAPFRQRYLTLQRSMQSNTGNLRGRLREMLAGRSADMARLAEVDAVMEAALSPREQNLLGAVPALLGKHFERLRDTSVSSDAPLAWLATFRLDMQAVLLAELDVRFQPVDALLAALRTR